MQHSLNPSSHQNKQSHFDMTLEQLLKTPTREQYEKRDNLLKFDTNTPMQQWVKESEVMTPHQAQLLQMQAQNIRTGIQTSILTNQLHPNLPLPVPGD